jgi:cellulose synthase/poly-beta-1,6-N-acetylglucosamine synthase-like glycosyltransferase
MTLEAVFWTAAGTLFYTFVGYPLGMAALARLQPRPVHRAAIRPRVSLLIVAHNEETHIEAKLENALKLEYPAGLLEIVLASDGSTDRTVALGRRFESRGVRVLACPLRRGKPSVLNEAIPQCRGDIVVLSDARQRYDHGAIVALVENFADPTVGAVGGELVLEGDSRGGLGNGLGSYWRYEKLMRRSESAVDSTIGATGAIYAIRRSLFEAIPSDTLLDDVVIPLRVVRARHRVLFEPRAMAFDRVSETPAQEFARKTRTLAGNAQLFVRELWLWNPAQNRLWVQAVSHKLLRLVAPLSLILMFAASAALAGSGRIFLCAFAGQLALYGAALVVRVALCLLPPESLGCCRNSRLLGRSATNYMEQSFRCRTSVLRAKAGSRTEKDKWFLKLPVEATCGGLSCSAAP